MEIFEDASDAPFNKLVESLFKEKLDLNTILVESKAITYSKWTKYTKDLEEVKTIEWPTKLEIYVWEAVGETKALPRGSN